MAGLALVVLFALSLPLTMIRVALAVQMQVTRVFWILDYAAAAYIAWWLVEIDCAIDERAGSSRSGCWRPRRSGEGPTCSPRTVGWSR